MVNILGGDDDSGRELRGLVESLGAQIAGHEIISVRERKAKFGIGSGKAEELAEMAKAVEADCMVFDWNPSPSQQRNWEALSGLPVIDRQELIIRIFAERASTKEAALQVKLAELSYSLPRLTHKYIDLSRQRGGRYGTKGSGETLLETDRRQIEKRIDALKKELKQVVKNRQVQRKRRAQTGVPVCAIVGYTNAGKSSLLNALTGSKVLVEDKLFATLDPATRQFQPAPGMTALLTDTVGFIRNLPHSLINAFRSTLEEASLADLLIHVVDASDPQAAALCKTTIAVLGELGAGEVPAVIVLNKIDRLPAAPPDEDAPDDVPEDAPAGEPAEELFRDALRISVTKGIGLDALKARIAEMLLESGRQKR